MIEYLKDKYYWWNVYNKLKSFLSSYDEKKILLFGYPKSGNTWLRFLLFNYLNLLLNKNHYKTLTYEELNLLQNNIMDRATTNHPKEGFPFFYRTHSIYKKPYDLFDFKIFVHRNPLDTLVSAYYFYRDRVVPFPNDSKDEIKNLHNIDYYVKTKFLHWKKFYEKSVNKADYIVNYSNLKANCFQQLKSLVVFLNLNIDEELINKSISLSSFSNIKRMSKIYSQKYGNAPKDGSFTGNFTRSGVDGQYIDELHIDTINFVKNNFSDFSLLYKL
tara:strand:- start:737 stop:1555 length:819 start_codon:yes stop_codon:yes gene_type:complete